jgi:hypothetical protein
MTSHITTPCLPQVETEATAELFDSWFDPVEAGSHISSFPVRGFAPRSFNSRA